MACGCRKSRREITENATEEQAAREAVRLARYGNTTKTNQPTSEKKPAPVTTSTPR